MSKKEIQKNLKLSLEFDTYVARHPHVLKSFPRGVHIVITSSSDKKLSEANRAVARSSRSGKFVEAFKSDSHWTLRTI